MTQTTMITVQEIHCKSCEHTIATALSRLSGVLRVTPTAKTNQVKVSWNIALSNFVLESATGSLSNAVWTSVTNVPGISGTEKSVIESNTAPLKYYRLKK